MGEKLDLFLMLDLAVCVHVHDTIRDLLAQNLLETASLTPFEKIGG